MATVIVNGGKGIISGRIRGVGTEPLNGSWGTGAGVAAIADTALFVEASLAGAAIGAGARTAGTSTQQTTTTTNDTYRVVWTQTASAAFTVTNAGLFDNITGGSGALYLKGDFTGIVLAISDSIQFTANSQFT